MLDIDERSAENVLIVGVVLWIEERTSAVCSC